MILQTGQQLAHYRLIEKIGEGGMGVVWSADDTKLGRQVAIKILPEEFAKDSQRLVRFEREARLLASLNHPNIAAIYDFDQVDGVRFLAMEMVPGRTLAEMTTTAALPVDETLGICIQIARGLEAAHQAGVIHRDLKPANVKVTPDGKVKVLDFGLAKSDESVSATSTADPSKSPTIAPGTQAGVVMGTATYMSPEQARGRTVDKRTDIWALGAVMFELFAGMRAFPGKSVADVLAAVIRAEPDWTKLPSNLPESARRALNRCLVKDPDNRLRDAGDVRLELTEALARPDSNSSAGVPETGTSLTAMVWILLGVAIITASLAAWSWFGEEPTTQDRVTRLEMVLPQLATTSRTYSSPPFAISRNGRIVAFISPEEGKQSRIFVRRLDQSGIRSLTGTEDAQGLFFSPDGMWLGFFTATELLKVPVAGGPVQSITATSRGSIPLGAFWTEANEIIYGVAGQGLLRVPASGGKSTSLTKPDVSRGEVHHSHPFMLPGGKKLLFTVSSDLTLGESRIALLSIESGKWELLLAPERLGAQPRFSRSGHVIFALTGRIFAVPFSLADNRTTGATVVVQDGVHADTNSSISQFDLSLSGTLIYRNKMKRALIWVDRSGQVTQVIDEYASYRHPRISPDGARIAIGDDQGKNRDIWVVDIERRSRERLTTGGNNVAPIWSPDGRRIVLAVGRQGATAVIATRADGSGQSETLLSAQNENWPMSWSADGRLLALDRRTDDHGKDIWTLTLGDGSPAEPLIATEFNEEGPKFSPDGTMLAYVSDRTGRREIYVATYPSLERKWQVSGEGGVEPVWSPDGRELFYRNKNYVLSVPLSRGPNPDFGIANLLFEGKFDRSLIGHAHFDVTPDGKRFVMVQGIEDSQVMNLVTGWSSELEADAPPLFQD
jgi:serine/threonine protein kinase/dipeptidyl aminopeptidase/acylaminoacyl peptidase